MCKKAMVPKEIHEYMVQKLDDESSSNTTMKEEARTELNMSLGQAIPKHQELMN